MEKHQCIPYIICVMWGEKTNDKMCFHLAKCHLKQEQDGKRLGG